MDRATYKFASSTEAWAFMRACDAQGIAAGFPGLRIPTVQVNIRTWMERAVTDKLANGAPVIEYQFAR